MTDEQPYARLVVGRWSQIEDVDDDACRLLGYSRSELLAMHGSELVLPGDQPAVAVSLDKMRRGEADWREGRLVRKDGSVVRVEVRPHPLPEDRVELSVRPLAG